MNEVPFGTKLDCLVFLVDNLSGVISSSWLSYIIGSITNFSSRCSTYPGNVARSITARPIRCSIDNYLYDRVTLRLNFLIGDIFDFYFLNIFGYHFLHPEKGNKNWQGISSFSRGMQQDLLRVSLGATSVCAAESWSQLWTIVHENNKKKRKGTNRRARRKPFDNLRIRRVFNFRISPFHPLIVDIGSYFDEILNIPLLLFTFLSCSNSSVSIYH